MSIYGLPQVRRMIDTRNGGALCKGCRYYEREHQRKDMLFGDVQERDWCTKLDRKIKDIQEGQSCLLFVKHVFSDKEGMQ